MIALGRRVAFIHPGARGRLVGYEPRQRCHRQERLTRRAAVPSPTDGPVAVAAQLVDPTAAAAAADAASIPASEELASPDAGAAAAAATRHPALRAVKALLFGRVGLLQLAAIALPLAALSSNPVSPLWDAYLTSLAQHPLTTKLATGAVGTVLGDCLAQVSQYRTGDMSRPFAYEPVRCLRLLFFTVAIATPWAIYWYGLLDKVVLPGQEGVHVMLAKMGVDQFIATPLFIGFFLAANKVLEGRPTQAIPFAKANLGPTLFANWKLWPLAMLFNFSIVPPDLRILFVNVVAVFWTAYLSLTVNARAR